MIIPDDDGNEVLYRNQMPVYPADTDLSGSGEGL